MLGTGAPGRRARKQVEQQLEFCGMLGSSPVMQEAFGLIQQLAAHARVVLICGETGAPKALAAR